MLRNEMIALSVHYRITAFPSAFLGRSHAQPWPVPQLAEHRAKCSAVVHPSFHRRTFSGVMLHWVSWGNEADLRDHTSANVRDYTTSRLDAVGMLRRC